MPRLVGFGWFAALLEEQISEEIGRRILSCDQRTWSGRALGPGSMSSLTVTQISRSFGRSTMFRLGSEQRVCSQGDVVVSPASCCRGEPPAA